MIFEAKALKPTAMAIAIALSLSSCASVDSFVKNAGAVETCAVGAALGAITGVGVAHATNNKQIQGISAIAGAATGCGVALYYQARLQKLEELAKRESLDMKVQELSVKPVAPATPSPFPAKVETVGIAAEVGSNSMFETNSASLTPTGRRQLTEMAAVFAEKTDNPRKILIVGHTDSTGSADHNQALSESRAKAVGTLVAQAGIPASNIYYQGAGASRPIADNTTDTGRAKNRRVELIEMTTEQFIAARAREEQNNTKYLAHGTQTKPVSRVAAKTSAKSAATGTTTASTSSSSATKGSAQPPSVAESAATSTSTTSTSTSNEGAVQLAGKGGLNFGGKAVSTLNSDLARQVEPLNSVFAFVSSAHADSPSTSCLADMPRIAGEVINLATGQALPGAKTTDFLPGMNGQTWRAKVNGNYTVLGPVSILRDDAKVDEQPSMQFYKSVSTAPKPYSAVANTYEGETKILYRVFAQDTAKSPASCMDVVFDKRAGVALGAEMFYPNQGQAYVAAFTPERTKN